MGSAMEPDLIRDAVIVAVIGLGLLVAGVPWRTAVVVLAATVVATVALEAMVSDLLGDD